eukprot:357270-Chlamydomonas_euryale.AAC.6
MCDRPTLSQVTSGSFTKGQSRVPIPASRVSETPEPALCSFTVLVFDMADDENVETKKEYQLQREHQFKIVTSYMQERNEKDAIDISVIAVDKFSHLKDIAFYIKQSYDKKYPGEDVAIPCMQLGGGQPVPTGIAWASFRAAVQPNKLARRGSAMQMLPCMRGGGSPARQQHMHLCHLACMAIIAPWEGDV